MATKLRVTDEDGSELGAQIPVHRNTAVEIPIAFTNPDGTARDVSDETCTVIAKEGTAEAFRIENAGLPQGDSGDVRLLRLTKSHTAATARRYLAVEVYLAGEAHNEPGWSGTIRIE